MLLRAAQVALSLRLGAVKDQKHAGLRGDSAESDNECEAVTLPPVEFGVLLHFFGEEIQIVEALIRGLFEELRKKAGFEAIESLHAQLAIRNLREPEFFLYVDGPVEAA